MASLPFMDIILHGWTLLALGLVGGGFAFTPLMARGEALAAYCQHARSRKRRVLWVALGAVVIAVLVSSLYNALAGGLPAFVNRQLGLLAARLIVLALLSVMLWRGHDETTWVLLPVLVLLLTQSLASHSAGLSEPVAPVLADWAHLTFTSLWLGGVAMLAMVSAPLAEPKDLGALIARFSPLAMFCVLAVILTGIVQSASFLGSPENLLTTTYGRIILVKIVLLLALIGLGAFHQQVISPRLQAWRLRDAQGAQQAVRRFRISILVELGMSTLILLAAGALTALAPAVG